MNTLYQSTPDGLCGDEDTGQMSAWYVFSALGIYPVCPGDPNYLIGSPIFEKASLRLAGGNVFTIIARDNGPQEYYVDSASLNGQPFNQAYIGHDTLIRGGQLVFQMASFPNYRWAADPVNRPPAPVSGLK
jgi:putative alpha-1,2-mannosidase